MSVRVPHNTTPLKLLNEAKITQCLESCCPSFKSLGIKKNLLTLNFDQKTIILPLTSTMTWGQLEDSLKEKGLIR